MKLIRWFFALVSMLVSLSAFATDYYWTYTGNSTHYDNATAACTAYVANNYSGYTFLQVEFFNSGTSAWCNLKHNSDGVLYPHMIYVTRGGSGCTSPKIYDSVSYSCITQPTCPTAGTYLGWMTYNAASPVSSGCLGYCGITAGSGACADGSCASEFSASGTTCSSNNSNGFTSASPPTSGSTCPTGTTNIGTDSAGVPICSGAPPDTNQNKTTTTSKGATTTNPDGSTTQVTTTTTTNNDGSTTTQTTTTNTDTSGNQTTTTTTTTGNTPSGVQGTNDSSPDQTKDICAQHPDLNICNNSQVSGTCGQTQCLGDAIQCATLRAIAKRNCEIETDISNAQADPMYTLGNSVVNGSDPMQSSLPSAQNSSEVAMPGSLDTSGWLASGSSCLPDTTFTLQGHTFTLPASSACMPLLAFRYALMVIALLVSFRMLSGVIFKS